MNAIRRFARLIGNDRNENGIPDDEEVLYADIEYVLREEEEEKQRLSHDEKMTIMQEAIYEDLERQHMKHLDALTKESAQNLRGIAKDQIEIIKMRDELINNPDNPTHPASLVAKRVYDGTVKGRILSVLHSASIFAHDLREVFVQVYQEDE